jgi:hypothetical protein
MAKKRSDQQDIADLEGAWAVIGDPEKFGGVGSERWQ